MTIREYIAKSGLTGGITDTCQAVSMLNAARELLYPLDDWTGTISYGCVRTNECCFYLPSHIETARKGWVCNYDVQIGAENWYYVDANNLPQYCSDTIGIVRTDRSAVLPVSFPVDNQIGFLVQDQEDSGIEVVVTAMNVFGSVVTESLKLVDIVKPVFAELSVREILSINKPATVGAVRVMAREGKCLKSIYLLEAWETQAKYWQYRAQGICDCLVVKGKKKFFPYKETDLDREIDIRPDTALQLASQAIEHLRSKRYAEHTDAMKLARAYAERTKEDLKKTGSPGVPARWEPAYPSGLEYGYR